MSVDSFKYLPRIIAFYYQHSDRQPVFPIPWTPLIKPVRECKFGLVTSAGIYYKNEDRPFDLEREIREKVWGDPTYRKIPVWLDKNKLGVSHLHINPRDIYEDYNIVFPVDRLRDLVTDEIISGMANFGYSFMGFQGFPPDTTAWEDEYGPQVAENFLTENVDCVLLTPA